MGKIVLAQTTFQFFLISTLWPQNVCFGYLTWKSKQAPGCRRTSSISKARICFTSHFDFHPAYIKIYKVFNILFSISRRRKKLKECLKSDSQERSCLMGLHTQISSDEAQFLHALLYFIMWRWEKCFSSNLELSLLR